MSPDEFTRLLGGWVGYRVAKAQRFEGSKEGRRAQVWIELEVEPGRWCQCGGCGRKVRDIYDVTKRKVRDLPILDADTWLVVPRVRVDCPSCGPRSEALRWLGLYARVTRRLAESVAQLCQVLPIKHVAEFYNLGWDAVKAIDKRYLSQTLGPVAVSGLEVVAMDEFAIQKGHRYATVIVDPTTKRVIWVGRGRGREDVRPFFELLGPEGCESLKAVVMDMNGAYAAEVQERCPQAEIVYDLFHVVAKYGREVVDRVRVDEANRLRGDREARKLVKGARWLLLRNPENVAAYDKTRLQDLLDANKKLFKVYVLKEDLKHLWNYRSEGWAKRFWKGWYSRAIRSRIEPLKKFARRLKEYLPGILAHCRWPFHTSVLEGINNKIKVIKRMAYGFRDDEYFFLKIRAAFPGNPG